MRVSIENLNYLPLQVIFDTVVRHMLTQAERSSSKSGACFYRRTRGDGKTLKCAVGCLIPDNIYSKEIEGLSASGIINTLGLDTHKPDIVRLTMLSILQEIHDTTHPSKWKPRLLWGADKISNSHLTDYRFSLSTKVFDEFPNYEEQFSSTS